MNNKGLSIPSPLVEFILLGPLDDRRQLQDSPILGDVWVDFGRQPCERLDLLIAPYRGQHAGAVAAEIGMGLGLLSPGDDEQGAELGKDFDVDNIVDDKTVVDPAHIAFLQGLVVARLTFREVMRVVVPKTKWWLERWREVDDKEDLAGDAEGREPQVGDASIEPENHEKPNGVESKARTRRRHDVEKLGDLQDLLQNVLKSAIAHFIPGDERGAGSTQRLQELPSLNRIWALTGLILWAGENSGVTETNLAAQISSILTKATATEIFELLEVLASDMLKDPISQSLVKDSQPQPLVYQVSRNRPPMPALSKSVPAVKADAATYLFKVDCSQIGWAVIDSGIDGNHPAFKNEEGKSRVKRSFDFKNFRRIVSLSNLKDAIRKRNIDELIKDNASLLRPLQVGEAEEDKKRLLEAHQDLRRLAYDARKRGPVHWELVEKYIEIKPEIQPLTTHGTHVAGIIGASKKAAQREADKAAEKTAEEKAARAAKRAAEVAAVNTTETGIEKPAENAVEKTPEKPKRKENPDIADGMCPDILLYDFRVLGQSIEDAEFAIIGALQFIRYLNDRDNFFTIHGANLSLSIPHDVRNFACGRTPICDECERLVSNGVVVVAAAGNHGYKSFETKDGSYDSYAAFSITDPGNADNILTVGATHRFWPHTYGVSFFSSRGPTGDGRLKPDLVAPGERIKAPLSGGEAAWGDLDGTSMAAPHVSGAAAMLMARYSELVGQPERIKRILCESATDLGRERSFQGHGMLDVLRAFQSI